jgi:hypothetical protein
MGFTAAKRPFYPYFRARASLLLTCSGYGLSKRALRRVTLYVSAPSCHPENGGRTVAQSRVSWGMGTSFRLLINVKPK